MKKEKTNFDIWKEELLSKPGMQEHYDSMNVDTDVSYALVKENYRKDLADQELAD